MAYTNIDDPSAYFQTKIYSGQNSVQSVTNDGNSNLKPDWLWIKSRNDSDIHVITNSTTGTDLYVQSNNNAAAVSSTGDVESFDTNGFSLAGVNDRVNTNGGLFVAWQWKANGGTTSSNTDGTTTSTVQVNSDAGFSLITFSAANPGPTTFGHGLSQTPDFYMFKNISAGGGWWLHHGSLTSGTNSHYMGLHSTAAATNLSALSANATTITVSSDFIGFATTVSCYAFHSVQGYSKFGSYVGNSNVNGPFIYLGFKPAFVMIKRADAGTSYSSWAMFDNKRLGYNPTGGPQSLYANRTYAEGKRGQGSDNTQEVRIDMLSNGFKVKDGGSDEINDAGDKYIYMAFAENPFVTSTGIPTTAR